MKRSKATHEIAPPAVLRGLAIALFTLSGAAALTVEVVWTRWLTLALGSSARATVLVLGTFMLGLGLGSLLAGQIGDRRPARGLMLFGTAELLVGGWALLSIRLLGQALPEWAAAAARAGGDVALALPLRAFFALVALLVPTILMGATLPLIGRWAVAVGGLPGRDIGWLYALNTLGGAAGCLLAAFWLIERLGLAGSAAAAGMTDIGVGLLAVGLALGLGRAGASERARPERPRPRLRETDRRAPALSSMPGPAPALSAAFGFGVSGMVGLGLEVVSHRVLSILAGSSAYAFAVMLAAFLFGIALGGLIGSWLADRVGQPGAWLAGTLAGLALGVGIARWVFHAGWWERAGTLADALPGLSSWSYGLEMAGCLLALLPATLMLGAAVPLVARLAGEIPERLAHRFGAAYAFNTIGAVAGAACAGLLLVPWLGTARSFSVLAGLAGTAGALLVVSAVPAGSRGRPSLVVVGFTAAGMLLGIGTDPVRETILSRVGPHELLAFHEGPVQTIAVVEEQNDQQLRFLRLLTNRTSLTGTHLYARRYMSLLGHLPALWTEAPRRSLVICLGTGMTAAALATHPDVETLDIVEISPEVVAVAPLFRAVSNDILDDPRTRLHVEDGRHVLLAAADSWDLITLEPPPPRDSGVVSLYSTDFYRLARSRLSPRGVLAQWVPLHSQSLEEVRALVRSFVDEFPHALGFLPVERELLLLGADTPLRVDLGSFAERISRDTVRRSLETIGLADAAALLATAMLDRNQLVGFAGQAVAVSDDNPLVEYFARFGKRPPLPVIDALAATPLPLDELLNHPPPTVFRDEFTRARSALRALLRAGWESERGNMQQWERMSLESLRLRPHDAYLRWAAGLSDEHLALHRRRAEQASKDPRLWRTLGRKLVLAGSYDEALSVYERAYELAPEDPMLLLEYGDLLVGPGGRPEQGRILLERLLRRLSPDHPLVAEIRRRIGR
ncbi:MAG: fused MFS/spermidine synthase [Acidobacteriota bacterium]|nr:MAG: fused MFS/spermidine synthase [Acidobacteriota bacterium]